MKTCEFTGKTTQEAIDHGLSELGVTIADVRVEVLQEGAKGLFGRFGSKPAKVRITVFEEEKEEDGGLSDLLGSFSLDSNTKKQKAKPQSKAAEPKKTEKKQEPAAQESAPSQEPVPAPRQWKTLPPKSANISKASRPESSGRPRSRSTRGWKAGRWSTVRPRSLAFSAKSRMSSASHRLI